MLFLQLMKLGQLLLVLLLLELMMQMLIGLLVVLLLQLLLGAGNIDEAGCFAAGTSLDWSGNFGNKSGRLRMIGSANEPGPTKVGN